LIVCLSAREVYRIQRTLVLDPRHYLT
jgi:hypothetical protein